MPKPGKLDEILEEVREAKLTARLLVVKLYGENGFEGDITEIKNKLKKVDKNEERSKLNRYILIGLLTLLTGGSGFGITKLMQILTQLSG